MKTYTEDEVRQEIQQEINKSSLRQLAKRIRVSPAYLSDVMRSRRYVSEAIAKAFGFERETTTTTIFRKVSK